MEFLTNDKLLIVGAGGAIGSNMAQTALMLGLTPNICLYDIYGPGVNGNPLLQALRPQKYRQDQSLLQQFVLYMA